MTVDYMFNECLGYLSFRDVVMIFFSAVVILICLWNSIKDGERDYGTVFGFVFIFSVCVLCYFTWHYFCLNVWPYPVVMRYLFGG